MFPVKIFAELVRCVNRRRVNVQQPIYRRAHSIISANAGLTGRPQPIAAKDAAGQPRNRNLAPPQPGIAKIGTRTAWARPIICGNRHAVCYSQNRPAVVFFR